MCGREVLSFLFRFLVSSFFFRFFFVFSLILSYEFLVFSKNQKLKTKNSAQSFGKLLFVNFGNFLHFLKTFSTFGKRKNILQKKKTKT